MEYDIILQIKENEIYQEMILLRDRRNRAEWLHCYLEWRGRDDGCFVLYLDEEGESLYKGEKFYRLNDKTVLEPGKSYPFRQNHFLVQGKEENRVYINYKDNRYLPVKIIKDGEKKTVAQCIDVQAQNTFVILKMHSSKSLNFKRFQRSSALLSRVISAYLPQLRDIVQISQGAQEYLAQCFEYFRGVPLSQKLPLNAEQAIKVFYQIAQAVHDMHRAGIIHRSMLPDHILLDDQNQVKIVGLSVIGKTMREDNQEEKSLHFGAVSGFFSPTEMTWKGEGYQQLPK